MTEQNRGAAAKPPASAERTAEGVRKPKNATRHFRMLNGRKPAFKRLMPAAPPKDKP